MQYFARLGPTSDRLFVSGVWDEDGLFLVESVIPGEPGHPATEMIRYFNEEILDTLSIAAHAAQREQERQRAEDRAAEAYEERMAA